MRNMKALVVDDSKVGRLTMQKKLEAFGVGVDLAESGLEALNYLEHHRPDVIFMDHVMPELDGFEATRRIKAAPPPATSRSSSVVRTIRRALATRAPSGPWMPSPSPLPMTRSSGSWSCCIKPPLRRPQQM